VLEFKIGAQVMFIKNDLTPDRAYFNGKLGRIESIEDDSICVRCDDSQLIFLEQAEWKNVKYAFNEQTKVIEEKILGAFCQYPLRLAWAITIHKSQGLTFERCVIDAQADFAPGQVYVTLSRCKSLEGIVLRSPIQGTSVKTDAVVARFTEDAEQNLPSESQLLQARRDYQSAKIQELFQFDAAAEAGRRLLAVCV